jgi:hypothetical protein
VPSIFREVIAARERCFVNKPDHGGKESGSGFGKAKDTASSRKAAGSAGAAARRPAAERSRGAEKGGDAPRQQGLVPVRTSRAGGVPV